MCCQSSDRLSIPGDDRGFLLPPDYHDHHLHEDLSGIVSHRERRGPIQTDDHVQRRAAAVGCFRYGHAPSQGQPGGAGQDHAPDRGESQHPEWKQEESRVLDRGNLTECPCGQIEQVGGQETPLQPTVGVERTEGYENSGRHHGGVYRLLASVLHTGAHQAILQQSGDLHPPLAEWTLPLVGLHQQLPQSDHLRAVQPWLPDAIQTHLTVSLSWHQLPTTFGEFQRTVRSAGSTTTATQLHLGCGPGPLLHLPRSIGHQTALNCLEQFILEGSKDRATASEEYSKFTPTSFVQYVVDWHMWTLYPFSNCGRVIWWAFELWAC